MKVRIKGMRTQEVTIKSYTLCDKCNEKIETESNYDAFECEFIYKTGDSYPEGGSGEKFELDLCQKCGKEAVELLKGNGFKVQESEWDW